MLKKELQAMNLTIDIPEQKAAALEAQARAAHMQTEDYLVRVVEWALDTRRRFDAESLGRHLDYMASKVAPETTPEEMEAALAEALEHARPRRNWPS